MSAPSAILASSYMLIAVISLALAIYALRHIRTSSRLKYFVILEIGITIWTFFGGMAVLSGDNLETRIILLNLGQIGISIVPAAYALLAIYYTNRLSGLPLWSGLLLIIEPVITQIIFWTDEFHQLGRQNPQILVANGVHYIQSQPGLWYLIHIAYTYIVVILATGFMLYHVLRTARSIRNSQTIAIILAIAPPMIGSILYIIGVNPFPPYIDYTVYLFGFSSLALAWSLFSFKFLDLIPLGRDQLVESLPTGMLVLDPNYRLSDVNPAAARILSLHIPGDYGKQWQELRPDLPPFGEETTFAREWTIPIDGKNHIFEIQARQLTSLDKETMGWLVMLTEVTHLRKAMQSQRESLKVAEALRTTAFNISSTLDENAVLDRLIDAVGTILRYDGVSIVRIEGNLARPVRNRGFEVFGQAHASQVSRLVLNVQKTPNILWMLINRKAMIIPDVSKYSGWQKASPYENYGSWLGAPILINEKMTGYFSLVKRETAFYTESDAANLEIFARQAALALENARLFAEVQSLASTDPLTGLLNRRKFFELAQQELSRSQRYGRPLSAIILDLDHFKSVNDRYGHLAGDLALRMVADACQQTLRSNDMIARYGGEEFIVLLPETAQEAAILAAERLRAVIRACTITHERGAFNLTVSLGVTQFIPGTSTTIDQLVDYADKGLMKAKNNGRDCVAVWQPSGESGIVPVPPSQPD